MASVRQLVDEQWSRRDDIATRTQIVDMQLAVFLTTGCRVRDEEVLRDEAAEPSMRVGGRWDRARQEYSDEPATSEVRIMLQPAQLEGWEYLAEWLENHCRIRDLVSDGHSWQEAVKLVCGLAAWYRILFSGGRRGGKTHLATVLTGLFCLACPGVHVVILSPVQKLTDEMRELLMDELLATEWRDWSETEKEIRFENGSRISLRTARTGTLKIGRVDLVLVNEAQECRENLVTDLRGGTVDRAGLTILAGNPPEKPIGAWFQTLDQEIANGNAPRSRRVWIDNEKNNRITPEALEALGEGLDELSKRRLIKGDMTAPAGNVALPSFHGGNQLQALPLTWQRHRECTAEVVERMTGHAGQALLGGLDWDKGAGCSYVLGRFFATRDGEGPDRAVLVIERAGRFPNQPEDEFGPTLLALRDDRGRPLFDLETTAWVGDASGRWQSTERQHTPEDIPSWARLAGQGFRIVRPDAKLAKNPKTAPRFQLVDSLLKEQMIRFLPTARAAMDAVRNMPVTKTGQPDRRSCYAHIVDALGYLCWRRWGAEALATAARHGVPELVVIERETSGGWR